jgi:uncharacterized GH25 family protein
MISKTNFLGVVAVLLLTTEAAAHDCFLIAKPYRATPGSQINIAIHIDDSFPGKHVAWNPVRITRFHHWYGRTLLDSVVPEPVEDSSGVAQNVDQPGLHLFVVDWAARQIAIEPKAFTQYLQKEGLEHILKLRKERKEENKPGRERYSRYLKTFVTTGEGNNEAYRHVIGQKIELIPLENPAGKKVGDTLRVRLLFEGKPVQGAKVSATYAGAKSKPGTYAQSFRTNKDGIALFRLTHRGVWLVRTVYMLPAESQDVDWESFWASMTFEIR